MVGMEVLHPDCDLLAVTEKGYGKRTPSEEYRVQRRGGSGILAMRVNPKVGSVVALLEVREDDELMLTSSTGQVIRVRVKDISRIGRVTQGVRVMSVAADERVVAVDVLAEKEEEPEMPLEDDGAAPLPEEDL